MERLIAFVAEHTIVNSVPIFLAAGALAVVAGPFLVNLGAGKSLRIGVYALAGTVAGLVSYASLTIPDRPMEFTEGLSLAVGMLLYAATLVGAVVFLKSVLKKGATQAQ